MTKTKRILGVLLTATILIGILPITVFGVESTENDVSNTAYSSGFNVEYHVEGNKLILDFYLDNLIGLTSGDFILDYDENILKSEYNNGYNSISLTKKPLNFFECAYNALYDDGGDIVAKIAFCFLEELWTSEEFAECIKDNEIDSINGEHFHALTLEFEIIDSNPVSTDIIVSGTAHISGKDSDFSEKTYTVVLGKNCEHIFDSETKSETCTQDGSVIYICSECGYTYSEVISAAGHTFIAEKTVAATCTTDGYVVYKCSKCDATEMRDYVFAKGHTDDDGNGRCDTCGEELFSHAKGQMSFFEKIIKFFKKIVEWFRNLFG